MKLHRLKINSDFRSLQAGFEVYFLRDLDKAKMWDFAPYCLVGRNGSGKSNVLEALTAIFYHIECIYLGFKPNGFEGVGKFELGKSGFFAERCNPDAFELEYYIAIGEKDAHGKEKKAKDKLIAHIRIVKLLNTAPKVECVNSEVFAGRDYFKTENVLAQNTNELNRWGVKAVLPDHIIGYSSGENEVLSLPFFKMRFINFDEYEERLHDLKGYAYPEGRLIYIDSQYSQAVMLTNYLMQDEAVLQPIYDTIGIKRITQFRIIINESPQRSPMEPLDLTEEVNIGHYGDKVDNWTDLLIQKDTETIDIKAVDKLKRCATIKIYDHTKKIWYLDYFLDEDKRDQHGEILSDSERGPYGLSEMKKAFRYHFNSDPFELFRAFQTLLTLNLYDVDPKTKKELYHSSSLYVNETVPTVASHRRVMRFKDFSIRKKNAKEDILSKSLSDGEHQYLHSIGVCLLFKNTNSLFLLDEPETHFNPDWRAQFISTLRNGLKEEEGKEHSRDLLITSHSPFIISDSHEENVLVFRKNEITGEVKVETPGFNTFGASINHITIDLFDRADTIGDYSNETIQRFENRFNRGENKDALIQEINRSLGDSVEKTILINRIKGYIKD
jgi:predicted ATPase